MIKARSRPERPRLFRSDLLEKLTVISPPAFVATWLGILTLVLLAGWGRASAPVSIMLVLTGLLAWSLFEYVMHRFLFHLRMRSELGQWLIFVIHGNHHVNPNDPYRNLMPPIISVVWSAAIWGALLLLLGAKGSLLFLGFAIGYVAYDSVHYACHQLPVRGRLMRMLRRHHIRHHHATREGNYAITTIFWDRAFGTLIPSRKD